MPLKLIYCSYLEFLSLFLLNKYGIYKNGIRDELHFLIRLIFYTKLIIKNFKTDSTTY